MSTINLGLLPVGRSARGFIGRLEGVVKIIGDIESPIQPRLKPGSVKVIPAAHTSSVVILKPQVRDQLFAL
jgi:hypothetical protein